MTPPTSSIEPALNWISVQHSISRGWDEVTQAFNHCYQGYLIPVQFNAVELPLRFLAEGLAVDLSLIVQHEQQPIAIAFIARRNAALRLAAFAIAPEWRGRGLALPILQRVLSNVHTHTPYDRKTSMELEVFASNAPAVALYQRCGFVTVDSLYGFSHTPDVGASQTDTTDTVSAVSELKMLPPKALAHYFSDDAEPHLPWQLTPSCIANAAPPWQLFSLNDTAFALVDTSRDDRISLRFIGTIQSDRRQQHASQLLRKLMKIAGTRTIVVPQLVPASVATLFTRNGFLVSPLHQLRMRSAE